MRLLFEGGFYYKLRCCSCGFYSRAATNNVFTLYLTIFLVSKHSSSSQSIQLVQLAIPEIKFSVWARFLARSARAKLGSAQLNKLKIWKSSAQLSSPFERGQLSSARSLAKNFRLVSPLICSIFEFLRWWAIWRWVSCLEPNFWARIQPGFFQTFSSAAWSWLGATRHYCAYCYVRYFLTKHLLLGRSNW